jgi:hypothetical protein
VFTPADIISLVSGKGIEASSVERLEWRITRHSSRKATALFEEILPLQSFITGAAGFMKPTIQVSRFTLISANRSHCFSGEQSCGSLFELTSHDGKTALNSLKKASCAWTTFA